MSDPKTTDDDKLNRELNAVGCPYRSDDHRARIWLDGYGACLEQQRKELAA